MGKARVKVTQEMRKKLSAVLAKAAIAKLDTSYIDDIEDFGPSWLEINEEEPIEAWSVSYGLADQVLALVVYEDFVEVGVGECMRPYIQLYQGKDTEVAVDIFVSRAQEMMKGGDM